MGNRIIKFVVSIFLVPVLMIVAAIVFCLAIFLPVVALVAPNFIKIKGLD